MFGSTEHSISLKKEGKTYGLIVDYIGIFAIEEVKQKFPELITKCLEYFVGVDRTAESRESLMKAQECISTLNTW